MTKKTFQQITKYIFLIEKKRLFPKKIKIEQFVRFLSGGPGVGKSWIINILNIFIKKIILGDTIKIVFMRIVTDNIGGMTINSAFHISIKKIGEFDIPDNPETDLNKKNYKK
jgi:hypothetical protein